jgi:hypothetical protein
VSFYVVISGDGVTYRSGTRAALDEVAAHDEPPSREEAALLAQAFLASLEGDDRQLRAGWLALRWLQDVEGAPSWAGPGYLFSFDTPEGDYSLRFTGEDSEDWPLPGGSR